MTVVAVTSDQYNRQQNTGRVSVRTSAGIPYVVVTDYLNSAIRVYKGNSATPTSFTEQDTANNPTSAGYGNCSAAIDGSGIIHIAYHYYNGKTSELRYVTFNTGTDAFAGDAQLIADIGGDPSSILNLYTAIAIDSNNVPHIAFSQYPNKGGLPSLYYTNKVGGSWNSAVEVEGGTNGYLCTGYDIAIDADNKPCISYKNYDGSSGAETISAAQGNANNATSFTIQDILAVGASASDVLVSSICVDSSGNHWVAYVKQADIKIYLRQHLYADGWTTWQTVTSACATVTGDGNINVVADGTDIYVFFENSSHDVVYDKYSGGAWAGATTLETGTFNTVKAKWARYVDYDSGGTNRAGSSGRLELDYTFADETATPDIWFNTLSLESAPPPGGDFVHHPEVISF